LPEGIDDEEISKASSRSTCRGARAGKVEARPRVYRAPRYPEFPDQMEEGVDEVVYQGESGAVNSGKVA